MFSYEERKKAVDLYIKYGKKAMPVIRELGYPNRHSLVQWYKDFVRNGKIVIPILAGRQKYTEAQKIEAVNFYLEHGKNIKYTRQVLGYPGTHLLSSWISELCPEEKRIYTPRSNKVIDISNEEKIKAVIELTTRENTSAGKISEKYNANRATLYSWKNKLSTGKELKLPDKCNTGNLEEDNAQLKAENERLKRENFQLQLMNDILTEAAKVLKKDQGISLETLTNREKVLVIDTLRTKYQLKVLLLAMNMAKSSYCYQESVKDYDKYSEERKKIVEIFKNNKSKYGSRRLHIEYCKNGDVLSERVIRRLMHEENLHVISVKMKKYNSYKGEISPAVPNLVKRNFHAEKPNKLWLTDITEFHIPAGKVYLSPIIDCYDGWIVKWKIGLSPNTKLTNSMLEEAIKCLCKGESPVCHSDRGFHYRTPSWIKIIKDAGLTRSMSKKGCSPDNSACEAFFGRLKNEFFYGRDWRNITCDDFMKQLDEYITWYNEERIKLQFKGSIKQHRIKMGIIAA